MNQKQAIIVEHAQLHNLDIDYLEIPLGKLVVVTGASGSGKTSLIYDTIAVEAQSLLDLDDAPKKLFNPVNEFSPTKITGITPIKSLKQKFEYFKRSYLYSQFIGAERYLNLLFANFGKMNVGENAKGHTPLEIFHIAQKLPKPSDEILSRRGYSYRYLFSYPLYWQLIPDTLVLSEAEKQTLDRKGRHGINLINCQRIINYFKGKIDLLVINGKYIVELADLIDDLADFDELIETIDVFFTNIDNKHNIDDKLLGQIQEAVNTQAEIFDGLVNNLVASGVTAKSLEEKLDIDLKLDRPLLRKRKQEFTTAIVNTLQSFFPASINIYSPITLDTERYSLQHYVEVDGESVELDFSSPSLFNPVFSKFSCKKCSGLGEVDEHTCPECKGTGFEAVISELRLFNHSLAQ